MVSFEKQIWKLFKMNRNEFNRYNRNCEKVLQEVFGQGKKEGAKEEKARIKRLLK